MKFESGKEITKAYGPKSGTTDWQALVVLLSRAWLAWTKVSGEQCPWDFENAGSEMVGLQAS